MKKLLCCALLVVWLPAHAKGVPTAGLAPVPAGQKLIHEFISPDYKNGKYTEVFVMVYLQNGYPAARYVLRSNDGKEARDEEFAAALSDSDGCVNKEAGNIVYRSATEFTS